MTVRVDVSSHEGRRFSTFSNRSGKVNCSVKDGCIQACFRTSQHYTFTLLSQRRASILSCGLAGLFSGFNLCVFVHHVCSILASSCSVEGSTNPLYSINQKHILITYMLIIEFFYNIYFCFWRQLQFVIEVYWPQSGECEGWPDQMTTSFIFRDFKRRSVAVKRRYRGAADQLLKLHESAFIHSSYHTWFWVLLKQRPVSNQTDAAFCSNVYLLIQSILSTT